MPPGLATWTGGGALAYPTRRGGVATPLASAPYDAHYSPRPKPMPRTSARVPQRPAPSLVAYPLGLLCYGVRSRTNPHHVHVVDVALDRCCCPAASARGHCAHLDALSE